MNVTVVNEIMSNAKIIVEEMREPGVCDIGRYNVFKLNHIDSTACAAYYGPSMIEVPTPPYCLVIEYTGERSGVLVIPVEEEGRAYVSVSNPTAITPAYETLRWMDTEDMFSYEEIVQRIHDADLVDVMWKVEDLY